MKRTTVILGTGPSLTQEIVDSIRPYDVSVVAVSDAWLLAPWADALFSQDGCWWRAHPEAIEHFEGRKLSPSAVPGVEQIIMSGRMDTGHNSGLAACEQAVAEGAKRLLLVGFDMQGTHFFGEHGPGLVNTPEFRFYVFMQQFAEFQPAGVEIVNCTVGSALACYPTGDLIEQLERPEWLSTPEA